MKKIALFGSTGSIGKSTLEVIRKFPNEFELVAISADRNFEHLAEIAIEFNVKYATIFDEKSYSSAKKIFPASCKLFSGREGLRVLAKLPEIDTIIMAIPGIEGILPTLDALEMKRTIALASKEVLVVAGNLVMDLVKKTDSLLLPIDSELNAIFQCLNTNFSQKNTIFSSNNTNFSSKNAHLSCEFDSLSSKSDNISKFDNISKSDSKNVLPSFRQEKDLSKIILTASGGPFWHSNDNFLENVTIEQALKHPNFSMGKKISIDSATMANKGLELIETSWMFDIKPKNIEIVIHPEQIVHSMVAFTDGSILGQMAVPSMILPIAYCLFFPERSEKVVPSVDFSKSQNWSFYPEDLKRFHCLKMARNSIEIGKNAPLIFNASNEIAVENFLSGKIKFTDIPKIIEKSLSSITIQEISTLDELYFFDSETRNFAKKIS